MRGLDRADTFRLNLQSSPLRGPNHPQGAAPGGGRCRKDLMMKTSWTRPLVGAAAVALAATGVSVAPAQAAEAPGEQSLFTVLDADGDRFDKNWGDYDIVDRAVRTVLSVKPSSAVGVLADGSQAVTAFLPTDKAFRKLVADVAGSNPKTEKATFEAIAATYDIDTIETVLLYHVVPGATITYRQAKAADGVELTMASGQTVTVKVRGENSNRVKLQDQDLDDRNAKVIFPKRDINKGNLQIAHGIKRVLRPVDLP